MAFMGRRLAQHTHSMLGTKKARHRLPTAHAELDCRHDASYVCLLYTTRIMHAMPRRQAAELLFYYTRPPAFVSMISWSCANLFPLWDIFQCLISRCLDGFSCFLKTAIFLSLFYMNEYTHVMYHTVSHLLLKFQLFIEILLATAHASIYWYSRHADKQLPAALRRAFIRAERHACPSRSAFVPLPPGHGFHIFIIRAARKAMHFAWYYYFYIYCLLMSRWSWLLIVLFDISSFYDIADREERIGHRFSFYWWFLSILYFHFRIFQL